jgi:molybdate transport system ATP-binding protein
MIWDVSIRKRLAQGKRSFSLDVQFASDAKRLVLFGPSGAGKSQTLQMLAGLSTPDDGHIRLQERTLFDSARRIAMPPQQRAVAYLFQDYALFPHLTVLQNIGFPLRPGLFNPRRNMQDERVARWLAAFELEAVAHHYPDQISGGQRQRAALARALVAEPRALLLDEPFAALDRGLRARLRRELAELQARLDIPMMLITHDEEDVACFADTVIRISNGRTGAHEAPGAEDETGPGLMEQALRARTA